MTVENYLLSQPLLEYCRSISLREPELLRRLREETARFPGKNMQVPPEIGQFLAFLVELTGARRVLELGSFTGYSALSMALALPADGELVACDGNRAAIAVAERYWKEAGVRDRIALRVGECADSLADLMAEGRQGSFDLAFVDADKPGYAVYYEYCLKLIRPGGLMLFDNVFMEGDVLEDRPRGKYTAPVKAFNAKLHDDQRVTLSVLPVADGLTLAIRKA